MKNIIKFIGVIILSVISKIVNGIERFNSGEYNNKFYPAGVKYGFNHFTQWEKDHYEKQNINRLNGWNINF
jgi:hypothetical protein